MHDEELSTKVTLKGHIIVPGADLAAVIAELPTHIELTRAEAGCLVFEVTQHASNPNRFDVYEEFLDKASFKQHQNRVKTSHWGAITQNVERDYQIS